MDLIDKKDVLKASAPNKDCKKNDGCCPSQCLNYFEIIDKQLDRIQIDQKKGRDESTDLFIKIANSIEEVKSMITSRDELIKAYLETSENVSNAYRSLAQEFNEKYEMLLKILGFGSVVFVVIIVLLLCR